MSNYEIGTTVRGAFPVETIDPVTKKISQLTLADHHSVVVGVMGSTLLLAYAGTDDDPANKRRPGYIQFPADVVQAELAGWRLGSFFIDASRLAFVPANKVHRVGKLGKGLRSAVLNKAGAVRQKPLSYKSSDAEVVTGARRRAKQEALAA